MDTVTENSGASADINRLKADLRQLREDLSVLTATLKTFVTDKAKQGQTKAKEAVDLTGEKIGEHPFISMLIALGAGFLVGFLIERNRRS